MRSTRSARTLPFLLAALLAAAGCAPARHSIATGTPPSGGSPSAATAWPGRQPDGSVQLHNQWSLRPAGRQVELADFPVNIAVHPGGKFAAVLHCGYSAHQILVVDLAAAKVGSRTAVHEAFYGIEFSSDGKRLFCSGAGDEVIHAYDFQDGALSNDRPIRLREAKQRGVPAGLALDRAANRLFAANLWGHSISTVRMLPEPGAPPSGGSSPEPAVSDLRLGTNVPGPWAAPAPPASGLDTAAAAKRAAAALLEADPKDSFPYACRLDEKRGRLYVSLWAQASVAVIDVESQRVLTRWPAQEHPCEMTLSRSGKLLFVANSARNTVTVFDTAAGRALETLSAALYPQAPPGSTPNSVALAPDEKTLFVANADNNSVAVFDVSTPGKGRSLGFIPVGWYPTSVRVTPDGEHLLVANGRGLTPKANPLGPQPVPNISGAQYIGQLYQGTLSIIDLPARKQFERQLHALTALAYRCSPLRSDASVPVPRPAENPIPAQPGQPSPIKYCLYIIKENRTYDQVLGDLPQANGDPKLCLFPERVTPNLHQLARQFVLLDNFYVDAEVSADGHEWSMGAYATDFVKKMWPLSYGHNGSDKFPYPGEGNFAVACPAGGYLWDRALAAGVSYRSYGEFVGENGATQIPALRGHFDPQYRGWDLDYPDVKRAARFIAELNRFEAEGDMPRLQILRLPNDHTYGATPGKLTPTALVADNDLALGQLVEAVSHSKFWPQTALFIIEDDAQNGPDHVDAHRTTAYVVSPYTKRRAVDSTLYSTTSMVRTIELILGLGPMSQFDAAATPMFNAFQSHPDLSPYQALPANVDLLDRSSATAWGGQLPMNFAREDAVDDLLLNEVVWRSVRGPDNPMPAPVRAAFVFPHPGKDND
jgi:YVTN family beta-propeller protein